MSPTRRLRGVAAFSAAALATAGLAGPAAAAEEECVDIECLTDQIGSPFGPEGLEGLLGGGPSLEFLRQMMEAQGLPRETIDQAMAIYEQMGLLGEGGELIPELSGASKIETDELSVVINHEEQYDGVLRELLAAYGGADIPEEVLVQLEAMYGDLDLLTPGQDLNDLFAKATPGDDQTNELADLFIKVEFAEDASFLKLGGPLTVAEMALAQAAANGDIDRATLETMFETLLTLLPEE